MLLQLGDVTAARPQRLEDPVAQLEAAIERGQVRAVRRQDAAVHPDVPRTGAHATSVATDRVKRSARLGHRLVPLRGRVAAPRDAAADVEGQPPAVGHERPDEDARLHRAVGADPAERPRVRTAAHRLQLLEDLHRPDLGCAGDGAAGERRGQQVEGVPVLREPAR